MHFTRPVLAVVGAAFAVCAVGTPASAGDPTIKLTAVQPPMNITIRAYPTYHYVCGTGAAGNPYVTGQWVLAIHGSRISGEAINQALTVGGQSLAGDSGCMRVYKFGASQGEYQASLTYAGVGIHVAGERVSYGAWQPGLAGLSVDITVDPFAGIL
jgi:hypothetical protein